ncbi:hypothetical protein [Mesorhizobium sp. M0977]
MGLLVPPMAASPQAMPAQSATQSNAFMSRDQLHALKKLDRRAGKSEEYN